MSDINEQFVNDDLAHSKNEGRGGVAPDRPKAQSEPYRALHVLSHEEAAQLAQTAPESLILQALAVATDAGQLLPQLLPVTMLLKYDRAALTQPRLNAALTNLDNLTAQIVQLRNGLATHR